MSHNHHLAARRKFRQSHNTQGTAWGITFDKKTLLNKDEVQRLRPPCGFARSRAYSSLMLRCNQARLTSKAYCLFVNRHAVLNSTCSFPLQDELQVTRIPDVKANHILPSLSSSQNGHLQIWPPDAQTAPQLTWPHFKKSIVVLKFKSKALQLEIHFVQTMGWSSPAIFKPIHLRIVVLPVNFAALIYCSRFWDFITFIYIHSAWGLTPTNSSFNSSFETIPKHMDQAALTFSDSKMCVFVCITCSKRSCSSHEATRRASFTNWCFPDTQRVDRTYVVW